MDSNLISLLVILYNILNYHDIMNYNYFPKFFNSELSNVLVFIKLFIIVISSLCVEGIFLGVQQMQIANIFGNI